jgi:hypothetical protein
MRISRADPDDPTGKRRRHFEISIDSPFTVLDCRATQANTALPRYSGSDRPLLEQRQQMSCGCPDAHPLDAGAAALSRPLTMVEEDTISLNNHRLRLNFPFPTGLPSLPQAAHLQAAVAAGANGRQNSSNSARPETSLTPVDPERPIHLIRHPSHNPPAFDADQPPPTLPLQTPPPQYDIIVGTPSVDGLADYFARLAAYEGDGDTASDGDSTGLVITPPASAGAITQTQIQTQTPAQDQAEAEEVVARGVDSDDSDTNTIGPDTTTETEPTPASDPPSAGSLAVVAAVAANARAAEVDPFSTLRFPPPLGGEGEIGTATTAGAGVVGEDDDDEDEDEDDDDEVHGRARLHRGGRVNVANPRTPGGRLVPSRSLEIERPMVRLDMTGVLMMRRGQ